MAKQQKKHPPGKGKKRQPTGKGRGQRKKSDGTSERAVVGSLKALQLKCSGASYQMIAEQLNISKGTAFNYVNSALDLMVKEDGKDFDKWRRLENERLDMLWMKVFPIAEDVLVSFGIIDLDSNSEIIKQAKLPNPLPLQSEQIDYVNANSAKGPWSLLSKFAKPGHRYFGFIFVGCRGCNNLERYWIYIKHGHGNESFYARRSRTDTFNINFSRLYFDTSAYLNELIPPKRRLPILVANKTLK